MHELIKLSRNHNFSVHAPVLSAQTSELEKQRARNRTEFLFQILLLRSACLYTRLQVDIARQLLTDYVCPTAAELGKRREETSAYVAFVFENYSKIMQCIKKKQSLKIQQRGRRLQGLFLPNEPVSRQDFSLVTVQ